MDVSSVWFSPLLIRVCISLNREHFREFSSSLIIVDLAAVKVLLTNYFTLKNENEFGHHLKEKELVS